MHETVPSVPEQIGKKKKKEEKDTHLLRQVNNICINTKKINVLKNFERHRNNLKAMIESSSQGFLGR